MAKQLLPDQHHLLHMYWPHDCCLCRQDTEVRELKEQIAHLEEALRVLQEKETCLTSKALR